MNQKETENDGFDENIMIEEPDDHQDHEINIEDIDKPKKIEEKKEFRRIRIPAHRMTPLRKAWAKISQTIVENLDLEIRVNTKKKCVEIRTSKTTPDRLNIQRAADFIKGFMLGFDLNDAIAMLRLDDLFLDTFEIKEGRIFINLS